MIKPLGTVRVVGQTGDDVGISYFSKKIGPSTPSVKSGGIQDRTEPISAPEFLYHTVKVPA